MAKIKRFEDIEAWQKARSLVNKVFNISISDGFGKDYDFQRQIRRSAMSIMANIAEGFGRRSNQEFANFLNYSHGSAAETQSHLYLALDRNYINPKTFKELYDQCEEISRMTLSLANYLRKKGTQPTR